METKLTETKRKGIIQNEIKPILMKQFLGEKINIQDTVQVFQNTWKTLKYLNINDSFHLKDLEISKYKGESKGRWPIKMCRYIFATTLLLYKGHRSRVVRWKFWKSKWVPVKIETKRNEINGNKIDRNETKRNNSKWNNFWRKQKHIPPFSHLWQKDYPMPDI
jgi:hypothetical protein